MLDSRFRDHIWPLGWSQFGVHFWKKMLLSAERSPLSDGSGSTKSRLEGHQNLPKMGQICGPWTGITVDPEPAFKLVIFGSFFCIADFASNPYFYSVFVQITISDVKHFGTIFVKMSHPRKPIWTGVGPFCGPRTAFQNGTTNSSTKKKNKNTPKKINMKPNADFCRKEPFCNQKKLFLVSMALGGQKKKKTRTPNRRCAKKHYKTRGFVHLCACS